MNALMLDARRRAMLDEMGVKVWWPIAAPAARADIAAPVLALDVAATGGRTEVRSAVVVQEALRASAAPVSAQATAAPSAAAHGAAVLVDAPCRLYPDQGGGAAEGGWLIVADMPPEADGRHREPFAGDAGRLLDNMLRALQLHGAGAPVHLMRTHRGVASGRDGGPCPFADAFAPQARALAPRLVLAMGPLAAQSLLQSSEPLGRLRGRAVPLAAVGGAPVVATYHPAYLLRNPADKARAWADLCLAAEQLARAA
jgi:uracil-DNA glycosylase family 4